MPEMDGVEAIKQITQNLDYDDIDIFLLSSDFSPENLENFRKQKIPAGMGLFTEV